MRKPAFCKCENKDADQLHGKSDISSLQHSSVVVQPTFVGPGRKPRRQVLLTMRLSFSVSGSADTDIGSDVAPAV